MTEHSVTQELVPGKVLVQNRIQVGILGPCEMNVDGRMVPLGSHKQRAVLAMLVIHRNRAVGIDELISAVWGAAAHAGARAALHTYVSNLRGLMTGPGIDTHAVLTRTPPGYRMSVLDEDCDVGRFTIARGRGVRALAGGHFEQAGEHLSGALSQWRGPVLDDLRAFTFFDAFATALAEEKLMTHIARAEAEIACGRASSVISELEALACEHPYREPLWAQLITAYYLAQRQSDALAAYHRLRTALDEDLGIDPGPVVQALYVQVLRQQPLDPAKAAQLHADETIEALYEQDAAVTERPNGPVLRGADGCVHPLCALSTRIGRSPDNNIVLADGRVSRHHAAIIETGNSFVIADLNSKNGVYVRDRRIHPSETLVSGDVIRIGDQQFTFDIAPEDPR
ncbi:BTAD domain-containing putative transcriptional regulator [Mycolicibacterium brisbanense]|uniref:Transcriptional regulatory protein EmbR n=1 Tax=Mycolicibacterium brisbanense TaxID=146020 RepID=A0A100VYH8_9MYCO|nr:FHA domain-containing protein [Mycolicibacterium brisbanense]GAS88251.1 transcriptional regulatory protein EmbR [Mycolicibacterium brisbanense]